MTHFLAGQYAEGAKYAALGIEEAPTHGTLHGWLALNCVGLGDLPRARAAFAETGYVVVENAVDPETLAEAGQAAVKATRRRIVGETPSGKPRFRP